MAVKVIPLLLITQRPSVLEPKTATYSVDTTKSNNILFIFQLNFKYEIEQYVVPAP